MSDNSFWCGIKNVDPSALPPGSEIACALDTETTGLDSGTDEIVQLALVQFAYDSQTKEVLGITAEYAGTREPTCPINPEAARVNHFTLENLRGTRLDEKIIRNLLAPSAFIVAHNAKFDKAFSERLLPYTKLKKWYCSCYGIDWSTRFGKKPVRNLQGLLFLYGISSPDAHRALSDAEGVVAVIAAKDIFGQPNLSELLSRAIPVRAQMTDKARKSYENIQRWRKEREARV